METTVTATAAGTVESLYVNSNDSINGGDLIAVIHELA